MPSSSPSPTLPASPPVPPPVRLGWFLIGLAVCAAIVIRAAAAIAADQPGPTPGVEEPSESAAALSVEEIAARIEAVGQDESLADEVRTAVR